MKNKSFALTRVRRTRLKNMVKTFYPATYVLIFNDTIYYKDKWYQKYKKITILKFITEELPIKLNEYRKLIFGEDDKNLFKILIDFHLNIELTPIIDLLHHEYSKIKYVYFMGIDNSYDLKSVPQTKYQLMVKYKLPDIDGKSELEFVISELIRKLKRSANLQLPESF